MIFVLLATHLFWISHGAVIAPPWADTRLNPCAKEPGGWQLLFWPPDRQCYKIFQVGRPCPKGMELSPALGKSGRELFAECRCPPKFAQSMIDGTCYQLFTVGPCPGGYYFGPDKFHKQNTTTSTQQTGKCRPIPKCSNSNSLFWLKNEKCYQKFTRGPCPKGQLLTTDNDNISVCACNKQKDFRPFRGHDNQCYQHFTMGPCKEKGLLFLPDRTCGCHNYLPHYHWGTNKCYELGTKGPCAKGELFTILPGTNTGSCVCRPGNIRYKNNTSCHRPFTQGPCEQGEILVNSTDCMAQPCNRGELYYPYNSHCYKIGEQGPCAPGKIISFDFEARPSIDGTSYNGVCMCPKNKCETTSDIPSDECSKSKGLVRYGEKCFKLYSQGPCEKGAWLTPQRVDKKLLVDLKEMKTVCDCIPGYTRNIEKLHSIECLPQTETINKTPNFIS